MGIYKYYLNVKMCLLECFVICRPHRGATLTCIYNHSLLSLKPSMFKSFYQPLFEDTTKKRSSLWWGGVGVGCIKKNSQTNVLSLIYYVSVLNIICLSFLSSIIFRR